MLVLVFSSVLIAPAECLHVKFRRSHVTNSLIITSYVYHCVYILWRYIIHVQAFVNRHILSNYDSSTNIIPVAVYWVPRFWYYYFIINVFYLLNRLHWTQIIIHVNWFSLLKKDISTDKKHFIRHYSVSTYIAFQY